MRDLKVGDFFMGKTGKNEHRNEREAAPPSASEELMNVGLGAVENDKKNAAVA